MNKPDLVLITYNGWHKNPTNQQIKNWSAQNVLHGYSRKHRFLFLLSLSLGYANGQINI